MGAYVFPVWLLFHFALYHERFPVPKWISVIGFVIAAQKSAVRLACILSNQSWVVESRLPLLFHIIN